MIKPEDEIIIDLSTSCTKDVAVAKLLGWMKGPIFPKVIMVNECGVTLDLLHALKHFDDSLEAVLGNLRDDASRRLVAAAESDTTYEELKEKEEAVTNIDSLIINAHMYMSDIDEELSKGESSELIIDQQTSEETGVIHITLISLDRWAKDKYSISILERPGSAPSHGGTQAHPATQDMEEDLDTKNGLKRIAAESFLTTFAFLVEAFYKVALEDKSIKFGEDEPNVKAISEHLEELAHTANKDETLLGQGHVSIKKRIDRSMEVKKTKLPQR